MPDSSFYAPGTGGGPVAFTDLTDATITTPKRGEAAIYNGTEWVNADPLNYETATIKAPVATRYYFPRSQAGYGGLGGDGAFLFPIRFGVDTTVNKFCLGINFNPPTTEGNSGYKLRAYIYNSNGNGQPNNLHADLGYHALPASNQPGGLMNGGAEFSFTPTTLSANALHWVGFAHSPINPAIVGNVNIVTDLPGTTDPFFNYGVPENIVQYRTLGISSLYNGSVNWSAFDFEAGTLPNNISNDTGFRFDNPRMGLRVSAVA